jgi:hypothetical protein
MANDVEKKPEDELCNLDGFDGFTDEAEGEDQDRFVGGRVIQGTRINFTNEAIWVDAAKEKLPSDLELIVVDIGRVVQKWGKDNLPSGPPITLEPNQKFPDINALNEKCPKSEWRERFGKLEGPYQAQYVVYLWDPVTMNKYTWPTSTIGGHICVADVIIQRWITLDGNTSLSATETPAITGPMTSPTSAAAKPATTAEALDHFAGMKTVTPPTAREATGDEVPY